MQAPDTGLETLPTASTAMTALLLASVAAVGANSLLLSPLLADIARTFESRPDQVARAIAVYGGATAFSALSFARLVDRRGATFALRLGLALVLAGVAGSAASDAWVTLSLAQGVAGMGAGIVLPACYAAAARADASDGRTLSRVLTGWSVAMVVGVPLAAAIGDALGWRASFAPLVAILAGALLGTFRLSLPGAASDDAGARPSFRRALAPAHVLPLLGACVCFMASFYGLYAFIGAHVVNDLGVSTTRAGFVALVYGVGFASPALLPGRASRRLHSLPLPACLVAVLVCLLALGAPLGFVGVLILAGAWGFANHLALERLVALISQVPNTLRGTVLGINSAATYVGSLIGAGGFALVHARFGYPPLPLLAAAAALLATGFASWASTRVARA